MPDTFSFSQLRSDIDELYRLLAELLEIDVILDGLEARGCLQHFGGVLDAKVLRLGVTEPFDVRYWDTTSATSNVPGTTPGRCIDMSFVAAAAAEAAEFRGAAQASLERLVHPLLLVRPEELRSVAETLVTLYLGLHGSLQDDFAGLRNEGADWEGRAADAFFDGYYEPLTKIRANHLWAIDYLTSLTAYLKAANDLGQQSLANLVPCAVEVVRLQLHERHERSRGSSTAQTLALLTAAAGIASVIAFPVAAGVGVALGSISYMLGYAASEVPDDNGDRIAEFEASSARQIHTQLLLHVDEVIRRVAEAFGESEKAVTAMRGSIDAMEGGDGGGQQSPSRVSVWIPRVPDVSAGRDFYHHTSERGL